MNSDDEIDRLLARGRLGGPRHDRIIARVVARTKREASRTRFALLAGVAAAGALDALIVVGGRSGSDAGGLRTKGRSSAVPASLDLTCVGGDLGGCPVGSTLMFSVGGSPETAFLAAYADPEGPGERIWYFSARTETPRVERGDGTVRPVRRGIRLGPEHTAPSYRVHVLLTSRPLDPSAPAAAAPLTEATFTLAVLRR